MNDSTDNNKFRDPQPGVPSFTTELQAMRHDTGRLTYDEIVEAAAPMLSRSTVARAFGGRALPTWRTTQCILQACGIPDDQIPGWKKRWSRASKLAAGIDTLSDRDTLSSRDLAARESGANPASPEDVTSSGTPATPCAECGALVLDHEQHQRWHADHVRRWRSPLRAVTESK